MSPLVGVLALQGDVREHVRALDSLGVSTLPLRRPSELDSCDALVIPGGESTTMSKLAVAFGLLEPLRERVGTGMPAFGTCAGMIMLADRLVDAAAGQQTIGGLDVTVRRNAFGRQVDSFETDLEVTGIEGSLHAVFIRAPWIESASERVEVLARVGDHPVAVRQGGLLATAFHPEVCDDTRLHRKFLDLIG